MERAAPARLRLTPRSAVTAVVLFGLTLVFLRLVSSSQRVLGWVAVAASLAALLTPAVDLLGRRISRGLAAGLVALAGLGLLVGTGYGAVDDVLRQARAVERAAPQEAARLERSERFGQLARDADLSRRVGRFVDEVPERLRGGSTAEALRAAATRGVAFLATGVLTIFFLLHGPGIAAAAGRQVHDPERRARATHVAASAYRRAFGYARGTIAMAALAGLLAYAAAQVADVPGPVPLALWVALWDVVPILGAVVGALPIVALSAIGEPREGLALAGLFLAYQVFEVMVLQRNLERSTIKVGPFLTVLGGFVGLELYGLGGALLTVLAVAIVASVADELASSPLLGPGYPEGMEESTKHGSRLDEALKSREDGDSRVEEFRQDQGPDEEERATLPMGEGARPDLDDQVDLSGIEERSEIARFLEPHRFPGRRDELIEGAREQFPPERILSLLRSLPDDRVYDNVQDVWEALGGTVEERF